MNIVHVYKFGQGVRVTFGGEGRITLTLAASGDGVRLGGGCAFRRDGFLPPQE